MKKSWIIVSLLSAVLIFSGCGKKEAAKESSVSHSSSSLVEREKKPKKKTSQESKDKIDSSIQSSSDSSVFVSPETSEEKIVAEDSVVSNNNQVQNQNQYNSQNSVEPAPSEPAVTESYSPEAPAENSSDLKVQEVINYFEVAKQNAIARKRDQINEWKANGEVNWSDEIISSGLTDFSNSLNDASLYYIYPYDEAVQRIDRDMQTAHEIRMVK